jgi:hypothetical protein
LGYSSPVAGPDFGGGQRAVEEAYFVHVAMKVRRIVLPAANAKIVELRMDVPNRPGPHRTMDDRSIYIQPRVKSLTGKRNMAPLIGWEK